MQLIYDKPASPGVANALKRARQLCEARWTPIRPLPSSLKGVAGTEQEYFYGYFRPWMPQRTAAERYRGSGIRTYKNQRI